MWNNLTSDEEFILIVRDIDNALYTAGLKYSEVIKMFNDEQADKWCERILNRDADYKYIQSLNEGKRNNLGKLQGPRSSHRKWWINKRFAIYDGKFISGDYKAYQISMKINQSATTASDFAFSVVPTELMNYGWGIASRSQGENVEATGIGERITFDPYNHGIHEFIFGTPLEVYEVPYISEIDLSCFQVGINSIDFSKASNPVLGTNLKKVILGSEQKSNDGDNAMTSDLMSGLNVLSNLEHFDIRGFKKLTTVDLQANVNLKEFLAFRSGLNTISLPSGSKLQTLELPKTLVSLNLDGANYLSYNGLKFEDNDLSRLTNIAIVNCSQLGLNTRSNPGSFNIFKNWYNQRSSFDGCVINMQGINWQIDYSEFELLQDFKSKGERLTLKGKIEITGDWTLGDRDEVYAKVQAIKDMFGEDCFKANGRTDVVVTCSPFIILNTSQFNMVAKEGNEMLFTCDVYPYESGSLNIVYEIVGNERIGLTLYNRTIGTQKIGVLKVEEERVDVLDDFPLTVRAIYTDSHFVTHTSNLVVDIINPTYPSSVVIEGKTSAHSGETQHYEIKPLTSLMEEATGTYTVSYELSGNMQYVNSHSIDGNEVTITFADISPETYATVVLKATVSFVDSALTQTFNIKVLNDNVIMTIDTNPVVFNALHNAGLVDDNAVLLRSVAEGITNLGTALSNLRTAFTFDEISEFTGLSTLANGAFANSLITHIEIPDFIKTIGTRAFDGCTSLTSVTLPTNEEFVQIKSATFRNCTSLSKIVLPDSITEISSYAFGGNPQLWSVTTAKTANNAVIITNNLITIDNYAFEARNDGRTALGCKVTGITITENLINLDKYLLLAPELKEINVDSRNVKYTSIENVLYSNGCYVLYRYPSGKVLDAYSEGVYETEPNCHRIDELAFFKAGAFSEEAASSDTYMGQLWTLRIAGLSEDASFKAIGNYAFELSTIKTLDISNNDALRIIPTGAFENCKKLSTVIFPKNLYEIQLNAFNYCDAITSLTIPDSVEIISDSAIINCPNLERLVLPRNMKYSGTICHSCNGLRSVMLPCYHTGATETEEGERTNPDNYNYLTIQCDGLLQYEQYKRYRGEELVEEDDGTIYFVYDGTIYTRDGEGNPQVFRFPKGKTTIEFCEGTVSIETYAFASSNINTVVIPGTVKNIATNAFRSCLNLTSVYMEEGVEAIQTDAFYQCTALVDLHLPETLWLGNGSNAMGQEAFQYCTSLVDVIIPSQIKYLKMWEFALDMNIRNVTIKSRDFRLFGARPFNMVPISKMILLSLVVPGFELDKLDSNKFGGMALYVPYGMVSQYEADDTWLQYMAQGMTIQELTFDVEDYIYVKLDGYSGENPYIVDPTNSSWGTNYIGTLETSGDYAGYYKFTGLIGVTDNKPLEIRDGSISGPKIADISIRYEDVVYDLDYILGTGRVLSTRALSTSSIQDNVVSQAEYDRLKCDVNSLKIKMNKLLGM